MSYKMHQNYYEAILQIRPKKASVLEFVRNESEKLSTKISKEISMDFGTDFYISSRKSAIKIGKQLKRQFKGTLKVTKSLHGKDRQSSKLIYRITILFRLE